MRKAYAADFGAGNTCLYSAKPNVKIREATPLNTPGGEPSGYVLDRKGTVQLGLGLSGLSYEQLEQIDIFHINIKAQPTEENMEEMVYYFQCWLEKMQNDHPEEFKDVDKAYWFIGCPTGGEWKKQETQELYRSIFVKAGYENVYIVPESNAALAFYQQKDHILSDYSENTKLLLIDQGAYSLDVTNYSNGKVTSYGGYLGASLIERMMVHMVLYKEEEDIRLKKRTINWRETVKKARELYEKEGVNGKFYTYLLLQARILKEDYFTQLTNKTLIKTADLTRTLSFVVEDEPLVLFTNPVMMENILEKLPIKEVLGVEFNTLAPEVQNEIGNKTWMQVFRNFLDRVDDVYTDLGQGDNTIIMLTGGGSLMDCVSDAIKAHYPNANVHGDKEAIAAIGKGLAYWAPDKIEALDFEDAFSAFTDREEIDEDGDSVNCINQRLLKSFSECVVQLIKDIVAEECNAVKYGIEQWRIYHCDNIEIPQKIETHLNDWCKNTGMPSFVVDIDSHITTLKSDLNKEFEEIIKSFNIGTFELLRKDDLVFLSNCKQFLPIIFDMIVKHIVSHYKENNIWKDFTNTRKKLFSDPRNDFYNASTDTLNKWLDKETDSTIELCRQAFFVYKYEFGNNFEFTFSQYFQLEGRIDLLNLMQKHVKEILGKLVLEEYIDS